MRQGNEKNKKKQKFSKVEIEGTIIGQDPTTQIITIVDAQTISVQRQVNDFVKIVVDSQAGTNIIISHDGKEYNVIINKGGNSNIIINQQS